MEQRELMKKSKSVQLSRRLQTLANLVTPGNVVADVGCDHGFLSIYLVQHGISPRVIAGDVRPGPLSAARTHVAEHGLEAYIDTRLSDGLAQYAPGEADTLILAGMGGPLMQRILTDHKEVTAGFRELILQPQSELRQFRVFLREAGWIVQDEDILCEDGKYYFMFRVIPKREESSAQAQWGAQDEAKQRLCDKYGASLLQGRHPVLKAYLKRGFESALAVQEHLLANRGEVGSNARLEQSLKDNEEEIGDLQKALTMFHEEV